MNAARPHGRRSIRRQLALGNAVILAAVFLVFGLFLRATVRARLMGSVDRDLTGRMAMLQRPGPLGGPGMGLGRGFRSGRGAGPPLPPPMEDAFGEAITFRPCVLDASGRVIGPADVTEPWDREAATAALNRGPVFTTVRVGDTPVRVLSQAAAVPGGARIWQVPYPLTDVERAMAGLNGTLIACVPVVLVLAAWAGSALTGRVLRPIRQITGTAGRIGADDLSARLPVAGDDEFGTLSVTFNAMLERLDIAFGEQERLVEELRRLVEQERRFTADASHELRTPLTVIKANTSLALAASDPPEDWRQTVRDIDRAADSASSLVRDLLLLARSDAGRLGADRVALPVRDLLEDAVGALADAEGAPIELSGPDASACVTGNRDELTRVFGNLLANARRHTPADGAIRVTVEPAGEAIRIEVRDTGPGVPPVNLPHLGERFYRVDAARSRRAGGAGLGLAISRSIVEAHGGAIAFDSPPGRGLIVTVTLPAGPTVSLDTYPPDSVE